MYPQIDCSLRTKDSFLEKKQKEHHHKDIISPLAKIIGLDPVRQVFLESMHLFGQGVGKSIIIQFIDPSSPNRLTTQQRKELNETMKSMSTAIPMEFQRKSFDITKLSQWEANQFSFTLLYTMPLLLKKFVLSQKYKHLLLLYVACRILFSKQRAVPYSEYARILLRKFFSLMPNMFGKDTQVINFHNIIHVVDDVNYVKANLSEFSAFPFENYLGQIKKLERSPKNPLVQVARRLHEMQSVTANTLYKKKTLSKCLKKMEII